MEIYGIDTETTGFSPTKNSIIELCIYRLSDDTFKTWCIKASEGTEIDPGALKKNGHKLEDITWVTKEGREKYKTEKEVIIEVENWLAEDMCQNNERMILAHNANFDKNMLNGLWERNNNLDTFPFSQKRLFDTMQIEMMIDFASGNDEMYGLASLCKKYGIKNEKAHSAEADTIAMVKVFKKQMEFLKKKLA